ncbi:MAG: hypothetical protein P4L57_14975 [Rhizomicrobium sp.]|nr:hypothetical protein [Rhizomicrobium sp.]
MSQSKSAEITVVPVESKAQWHAFHALPQTVYRDDPHFVAPLLLERKFHFDTKHNAFFKHAKGKFWLALKDGVPVGRITAQIDALHLAQHNDATGHFGFLEGINDPAVFAALLATAEAWLKAEGMTRAVGPISFNMWDEPGLLVDGFESPPNVLMGHHLPYYQDLITAQGYVPVQDLLAYTYPVKKPFADNVQRLIGKMQEKHSFVFRPARMDKVNFPKEVALIRDIINDAWAENWGFVPMTEAEVEEIASLFKIFLKPEALVIGEYDGEPIGVAMMLPNINECARDLNGKLFPFGIAKFLWRLKVSGVRSGRLALLGVRRKYWSSPVGAIIALMMVQTCQKSDFARNVETGELSWVLDSNERIKAIISQFGATISKRYRIFEKPLG